MLHTVNALLNPFTALYLFLSCFVVILIAKRIKTENVYAITNSKLVLESGALRVLVPVSNKTQFAGLPEDVIERLDIVFYGDVDRAVLKTLEM